jgi:hypothetical protein
MDITKAPSTQPSQSARVGPSRQRRTKASAIQAPMRAYGSGYRPSPLLARHVGVGDTPLAARLVSAAGLLVHSGSGTRGGFLLRDAALLVAFFDVLGRALLLVGVLWFVAAGHELRLPFAPLWLEIRDGYPHANEVPAPLSEARNKRRGILLTLICAPNPRRRVPSRRKHPHGSCANA